MPDRGNLEPGPKTPVENASCPKSASLITGINSVRVAVERAGTFFEWYPPLPPFPPPAPPTAASIAGDYVADVNREK